MKRFEVFKIGADFVLNIQSEVLTGLSTRVVVPLVPRQTVVKPIEHLNPVFKLPEGEFVMRTQFIGAVFVSELNTTMFSLDHEHDRIIKAVDMLSSGV